MFYNKNIVGRLMKKPHIYITYTNTGAGHSTPALAIADRIEDLYPNKFQITTSNFFDDVGEKKFNRRIEKQWNYLLKHPLTTKMILFMGHVFYKWTPRYIPLLFKRVWKNSVNYIQEVHPDLLFTTHFFTHTLALDAREHHQLDFPIIALNPDTFETFPQWDRRGDVLLVCSDLAIQSARKYGHEEDKLMRVPQALRKEFEEPVLIDKKSLQKEYGLREDAFTILMSDGGQGIGLMLQTIGQVIKISAPIDIIAICGRNEKLYRKLQKIKKHLIESESNIKIAVFGFVDSITPFIQISDLFIGKSGPASVLECLKLRLPVIVNFTANSAEKKTAEFFTSQKGILSCTNLFKISSLVENLILCPAQLEELKENISHLNLFQNGTDLIAKVIVHTLEKSEFIKDEDMILKALIGE